MNARIRKGKKKHSGRKPEPSRRRVPATAMGGIAVAIVAILAGAWWFIAHRSTSPSDAVTVASSGADFQRLVGRWQRSDGGYVIEIKTVADGGVMEAAYFNPRPIHVATARASQTSGVTQVFIELRDENYPGSTYRLTYDPSDDRLKGTYFQAVAQETFGVSFVRLRP